ncbi:glycosyltransferase family 2 protein [Geodermatophilus sp. SYSU D00766]
MPAYGRLPVATDRTTQVTHVAEKTSVVIVAYRSAGSLSAALEPLLHDNAVGEIIVVDNSAEREAERIVHGTAGRVAYVAPPRNLGFAGACEFGLQSTSDPVVTFLNADVVLTRGIAPLVALCANGGVVASGGLRRSPDASHLSNARHRVTLWLETKRATLGSSVSLNRLAVADSIDEVAQVDGAFLMVARNHYQRLGGFDQRFELYFEDVDFCERARASGRVLLDRRAYGVHEGGGSSSQVSEVAYCVFRVSRLRYARKRFGLTGALIVCMITIIESVVRGVTRQGEGGKTRRTAFRLVVRELNIPQSVTVLR